MGYGETQVLSEVRASDPQWVMGGPRSSGGYGMTQVLSEVRASGPQWVMGGPRSSVGYGGTQILRGLWGDPGPQ